MIWRFGLTAVLIGLHLYLLPASWAQEEESKSPAKPVYLKVCGSAATDQSKTLRLLPDVKKLREGNAADLLKAIALAERRQDTSYIAQVKEIKALTVDDPLDPEIEELTTSLESMFEALKVAAETGNADWDLRLDEVRWDQLEFNELPVLMLSLIHI